MAFKDTTARNAMNYYISDLHIGHENILRFDNRPFADVTEMNNKLIENWNAEYAAMTRSTFLAISSGQRKASGCLLLVRLAATRC